MNIDYTIQVWREDQQFVAHAMPLDVMSSGPTPAGARAALYEAVDLFLATAAAMDSLDEILEESGYAFKQGEWCSPVWVAMERHSTPIAA